MTEGVDISTDQTGISPRRLWQSGIRFVEIKAGGANAGLYTAPHYVAQVDAFRPVFGAALAHYWLTGAHGTVVEQADYFAARLHDLRSRDALMLDNEFLNDGRLLTDAEAATFFVQLRARTHVAYQRMWLYVGAATLRAHAWPECRALGVRLNVAAYGANDGVRRPPDLGGQWPAGYTVHQYTSRGRLADFTIDRDYAPLSIGALFPANPRRRVPAPAPLPARAPSTPPAKPAPTSAAEPGPDAVDTVKQLLSEEEEDMKKTRINHGSTTPQLIPAGTPVYLHLDADDAALSFQIGAGEIDTILEVDATHLPAKGTVRARIVRATYKAGKEVNLERFTAFSLAGGQVHDKAVSKGTSHDGTRLRWEIESDVAFTLPAWQCKSDIWTA